VRVIDVVLADQQEVLWSLANALVQWHFLVCKPIRTPDGEKQLKSATHKFYSCLEPFKAAGVNVNTPKLHRMWDVPTTIRLFGDAKSVSTDFFEMAHKELKSVYPR